MNIPKAFARKQDFLISLAIVFFFIVANVLVTASANETRSDAWDAQITSNVNEQLQSHPRTADLDVAVETNNARVTLRGDVMNAGDRRLAATIAQQVEGVATVSNRLQVAPSNEAPCARKGSGIPKIIRPNG